MKLKPLFGFFVLVTCAFSTYSQTSAPNPTPTRQRIIVVGSGSATPSPTATPQRVVVTNSLPATTPTPRPIATPVQNPTPIVRPDVSTNANPSDAVYKVLNFAQLKNRIAEAKRQMQVRPLPTSLTDSFLPTSIIRIAFHDWNTNQVDYAVMSKDTFLSRGAEFPTVSTNGKNITIRIIRANGVNTPVSILDSKNQALLPLLVQYPVEKGGRHIETAYYISTHPGLVTPETVNAGKYYVRNTLEAAREKLRQKGIIIQPQVADVAEHLAIVEHIDHQRFWTEANNNLFNEVYVLFALNEGGTYRYSVSSAGAGGMVQMIPSTYRMIRARYSHIGLMPDFVEGMRNHLNAAQAMLLYMQMTWNDLIASPTIANALENGIATQPELLSAGYNSNPARLPGYVSRGGTNWRTLIPRETKIYLQIYASMERFVAVPPRTK